MKRFSAGDLKLIAMVTMFIDHAAEILLSGPWAVEFPFSDALSLAMRFVGRLSFPLFAFLLVEGFLHTRDWKKYALRLLAAAVISEIPYNLATTGTLKNLQGQNVMVTLLIALLVLAAVSAAGSRDRLPRVLATVTVALAGMAAAVILKSDYDWMGILLVLTFYLFRYRPDLRQFFGCAVLLAGYLDVFALVAALSFYFINGYNGEKGRDLGYFPYLFYPAHLLLLCGVGVVIHGLYY